MSETILRDPELLLTPFCTLTRFPRMEWSRRWDRPTLPVGTGFRDAMVALLAIERIASAGLRDRRVGKGKAAKPLTAKECARGLAPYVLRHGDRRCKVDVLAADAWSFVVHDIDAAPVAVVEMLDIVERAVGHLAHATWTTWSCRDGYASARVFLLLSRTCTTEEAAAFWWWTRRLLVAAGMPEGSAKAGEPTMDSRAMDGRLFYGPSVPTPMSAGVEGWGGTVPRGKVTDDDVPPLDVDAFVADARRVRAEDEPVHLARFPGVPVPGAGTTRTPRVGASSKKPSAGSGRGPAERVDFATKAFEGTTLLEWVRANLPPGTEVNVGSPWRPDGGSGVAGRSLRLHHEIDGRIWAKDFPTNTTYHHELEVETSGVDSDALLGAADVAEPTLSLADEFEADRKAGLVSDVFLFAKEMGEALTEHPLVIDHVALRVESRRLETLLDESDERMSAGLSMSSIESPADIDVADEDVEVAIGLVGGSTWINCTRGPWAYRPVEGGFTSWRIPCKSSLCPACGPWMMAARRASATVLLGNLGRSGWSGTEPSSSLSATALRAVRRWVDEDPGSRAWLRSRSPDGTLRDLLAWASMSESPPVTTAVGKLLLGGRVRLAPSLEVWASDAIPVSEHGGDESKGMRVLTGTAWLVARIHALRDKVLRSTGDGKSKITVAPPSEVKDRIERVAGGLAREVKGTGQAARHRVERWKGDPSEREMEAVFATLGAVGTWRRKALPIGEIGELSLASK